MLSRMPPLRKPVYPHKLLYTQALRKAGTGSFVAAVIGVWNRMESVPGGCCGVSPPPT